MLLIMVKMRIRIGRRGRRRMVISTFQRCLGPDIWAHIYIILYDIMLYLYPFTLIQHCLGPDIPSSHLFSLPSNTLLATLDTNDRLHHQVRMMMMMKIIVKLKKKDIYFVLKIISAGVRELDAFIQTVLHSFAEHKSKVVCFIFLLKYQNYNGYYDSHIPLWSYANIPCLLHSSSGRFPAIAAIIMG